MLKTLNQIKKEFQTIADDHRQINNYYFGDFLSAMKRSDDDGQRLYKYLIVTPSTITHSRNYTATTLLITICDRVLKGYEDQDDIHSDAIQILNDIYATFFGTRWQEFVDVDSDGNSTLFIDKSLDGVAGASMSISIKIYSEDNLCAIPYENNSPINPDAGCLVSTITDSDGVSTFTVVSGGTGTCTPQIKSLFLKSIFAIGDDIMESITIDADNEGTFTSITDDGASGTITLDINGAGYGAFVNPTTLTVGDTLIIKRTVTTASGTVKLIGTYV